MSSACWTEGDSRICIRWHNCLGVLLARACREVYGLVSENHRSVVERRDLRAFRKIGARSMLEVYAFIETTSILVRVFGAGAR